VASDQVLDARVRPLVEAFLTRLDDAVPGLLERVYVTGSSLTEDWQPSGADVDLALVVRRPLTDDDAATLTRLHATTKGPHPVDGIYLTADQLAAGPDAIAAAPQVVEGDFGLAKPDGQLCWVTWVELSASPVARITAAGDVGWSGPEPPEIADLARRAADFSRANLAGYWASLGDRAEAALDSVPDDAELPTDSLTWVTLGPARLLITIDTGRVVSKTAGARYAAARWPEFADLIARAIRARRGEPETFTAADARQSVAMLRRCVTAAR